MSTPRDDAHSSPWSLGSIFQDIYLTLFRPKFKVRNSNLVETLNLRGNSARGHLRNERSLKKIGTQKIRCKLFVLKKNQGTNTAGRICIHMDAITCCSLLLVLRLFQDGLNFLQRLRPDHFKYRHTILRFSTTWQLSKFC